MIPDDHAVEIYSRDINNDETADFFLKGHIYGCKYERGSRLPKAQYFAPYFGRIVSASHPGLQEGISYVAKIASVQVAETASDFKAIEKEARRNTEFYGDHDYIKEFRKWFFSKSREHSLSIVFLSVPRLAFNPTIKKTHLRKTPGFIGKGDFTFDQFYQAWGGKDIF